MFYRKCDVGVTLELFLHFRQKQERADREGGDREGVERVEIADHDRLSPDFAAQRREGLRVVERPDREK